MGICLYGKTISIGKDAAQHQAKMPGAMQTLLKIYGQVGQTAAAKDNTPGSGGSRAGSLRRVKEKARPKPASKETTTGKLTAGLAPVHGVLSLKLFAKLAW